MNHDFLMFLGGIGVLITYLIVSAATEMGTKLPWRKSSADNSEEK